MFHGPLSEHAKQQGNMTNSSSTNGAGVVGMAGSAAAAAASSGKRGKKTTVAVSDVDGRAFDILLRSVVSIVGRFFHGKRQKKPQQLSHG